MKQVLELSKGPAGSMRAVERNFGPLQNHVRHSISSCEYVTKEIFLVQGGDVRGIEVQRRCLDAGRRDNRGLIGVPTCNGRIAGERLPQIFPVHACHIPITLWSRPVQPNQNNDTLPARGGECRPRVAFKCNVRRPRSRSSLLLT